MKSEENKKTAVEFLNMVVAGEIEKAYLQYVKVEGKHHNAYFPAGFPALQKGMIDNEAQFPHKQFMIKHVLGEGDMVAVHSHVVLKPNDPGMVTLHLFRFEGDRIAEIWDCGMPIPADILNQDGVF